MQATAAAATFGLKYVLNAEHLCAAVDDAAQVAAAGRMAAQSPRNSPRSNRGSRWAEMSSPRPEGPPAPGARPGESRAGAEILARRRRRGRKGLTGRRRRDRRPRRRRRRDHGLLGRGRRLRLADVDLARGEEHGAGSGADCPNRHPAWKADGVTPRRERPGRSTRRPTPIREISPELSLPLKWRARAYPPRATLGAGGGAKRT